MNPVDSVKRHKTRNRSRKKTPFMVKTGGNQNRIGKIGKDHGGETREEKPEERPHEARHGVLSHGRGPKREGGTGAGTDDSEAPTSVSFPGILLCAPSRRQEPETTVSLAARSR